MVGLQLFKRINAKAQGLAAVTVPLAQAQPHIRYTMCLHSTYHHSHGSVVTLFFQSPLLHSTGRATLPLCLAVSTCHCSGLKRSCSCCRAQPLRVTPWLTLSGGVL